jgi:hypothetical protein
MESTFRVTRAGWHEEIERLLTSFLEDDNPLIMGGLTIDSGHDYWVILEYGASPASVLSPEPAELDAVILRVPSDIPKPKRHRRWYKILPKRAKRLVFMKDGRLQVRKQVRHPGSIIARGFIRRLIAKTQAKLYKELLALDKDDTLPDRSDLRRLVNGHLVLMLKQLKAATPVQDVLDADGFIDDDASSSHLSNAWGVDLAQ